MNLRQQSSYIQGNSFDYREAFEKYLNEKNERDNSSMKVSIYKIFGFLKLVFIAFGAYYLYDIYKKNTIQLREEVEEEEVIQFNQIRYNQTIEFEDGGKFFGSTQYDLPSGYGESYWPNGSKYKGQWEFGQKNGYGYFEDYDGSIFKGNWRHNKKSGQGNFISSLYSYQGYYVDGLKEGQGNQTFSDFRIQNGTFKNDKLNGYGTEKYFEQIYEGEWENGYRSGKGYQKYQNGDTYDGNWKNGIREGKGIFISQKDGTYDGMWMNDKRNGQGEQNLNDYQTYKGGWKDDKFHGQGELFIYGKMKQEGIWYAGKMEGFSKLKFAQQQQIKHEKYNQISLIGQNFLENIKEDFNQMKSYEGELKNNKPFGKGRAEYDSGETFEGNFDENGKRSGYGESENYVTQSKYYGNWKYNQKEGKGEEIDEKGFYDGHFKYGLKHGHGTYTFKSNSEKLEGEFIYGKYVCPNLLFSCRKI